MNPLTVRTVLRDVIQACVDSYTHPDAPTIPHLAFVTHGQPVWIGEQLTVSSGGISSTRPFPLTRTSAVKTSVVPGTTVNIEVVRDCWPQPQVSSVSKQTVHPSRYASAAEAVAMDAATIFAYIAQRAATGILLPSLPSSTAADIALGAMVPIGPIGTKVGYRWPIQVKLAVVAEDILTGDPLVWIDGTPIIWGSGEPIEWVT